MIADWPLARRIATLVMILALAWDAAALVRLFRSDAEPPSSPVVTPVVPSVARRALDDPQRFTLAASRAPFGISTDVTPSAAPTSFALPVSQPKLTGTVVQGTSGFVVIELTDGTMRLVRLGERAAGLTLRAVAPGLATFTDSTGHRIVLHSSTTETATRP
jgi:hypothetical protein